VNILTLIKLLVIEETCKRLLRIKCIFGFKGEEKVVEQKECLEDLHYQQTFDLVLRQKSKILFYIVRPNPAH